MFPLNLCPDFYTCTLHAQNKANGNTDFFQPYPVVAADALLEIIMALISAVFSPDEHFSQTGICNAPK
jgi:hypothetical protein